MSIEPTTEERRTLSDSADGKKNLHFLRCPVVGHCRPYAACLSLIAKRKARELDRAIYADCSTAIKGGSCPALGMRQNEELAGHALHFTANPKVEGYAPPEMEVVLTSRKKVAPAPSAAPEKHSLLNGISTASYADAINGHIETAQSQPVATPVVRPVIESQPRAGETPLEFARRVMAAKNQPAARSL